MYQDPVSHMPDPQRQSAFYEGVAIKRGIAWVIDVAISLALVLPLILMTAFIGLFFLPFLMLLVGFLYRWATISAGSATWGMWIMAIEIRDAYGQRLDAGQAFLHTLGYTLSFSLGIVQLASIVLICVTERGQSLTDMVLGTTVLNRRA